MKQQLSHPTPVDVRVGEQIEMLRRARGLTQQHLVTEMDKAGLRSSVKIVCMIENGQRVVTQAERAAFAKFFNVKITHLTGPEPTPRHTPAVQFGGAPALTPVEAAEPLIEYDLPGVSKQAPEPSLVRAIVALTKELRRANELQEFALRGTSLKDAA
jgi:transcriptional regulator with XRE-family HTH domain